MVTLRRFAVADLAAILTIQHMSPEAAQWPATEWRVFVLPETGPGEILRAGYCGWIAHANDTPAGFLAALFSGEELEILNLAVAPDARRAGIATRLMESALSAARSSGGNKAHLEVRASSAGAIVFYERIGFLPIGRRLGYYVSPVEDAILLSCAL